MPLTRNLLVTGHYRILQTVTFPEGKIIQVFKSPDECQYKNVSIHTETFYTVSTWPETCIHLSQEFHYLMCCAVPRWGWQLGVYGSPCPHLDSMLKKAPVCLSVDTLGVGKLIGSGSSVLVATSHSADPELCL